jgi:hypothetical protein
MCVCVCIRYKVQVVSYKRRQDSSCEPEPVTSIHSVYYYNQSAITGTFLNLVRTGRSSCERILLLLLPLQSFMFLNAP